MKKYISVILVLFSLNTYANERFSHLVPAFENWLGKPLDEKSFLQEQSFELYYRLAQYTLHDYLSNKNNGWEIVQIANYNGFGQRIGANREDIVINNQGESISVYKSAYYFIQKEVDGEMIKAVAKPYQVYQFSDKFWGVRIYYPDKRVQFAQNFLNEVRSYLVEKNFYRNTVIHQEEEWGRWYYRFLENVADTNSQWEHLILEPKLKKLTFENTYSFIDQVKSLFKKGLKVNKGVLLAGPPGTGKSFLGEILISQILNGNLKGKSTLIVVTARHLTNLASVQTIFNVARQLGPTTIFMEDVDLLGIKKREPGNNQSSTLKASILNELLNEMDGVADSSSLLMIGTTNKAESLDPALLRSGRLGLHFTFGLPAYSERKKFFESFAVKRTVWEEGVTFEWLAGYSEGLSGADIIEVIALTKQKAYLAGSWSAEKLFLKKDYFIEAFATVTGTDSKSSYKAALKKLDFQKAL